jgi:plastocyanin
MRVRTFATALAATLAAVSLVACSSDDSNTPTQAAGTTAPTASATVARPASPTASAAASSNALTVTASDYAFKVSGPVHPGSIDITFDNTGKAYHMLEMAPLKDGVTEAQLQQAASEGDEEALDALFAGDPEQTGISGLPGLLGPGAETQTLTTISEPGRYALLCFVPGPEGAPHVAMGMVGTLDVTGQAVQETPDTDGTITLTDSGIDFPAAAKSGQGWFAVKNTGTAPHTISIASLPNSATLDSVYQWIGGHFAQSQPLEGGPGDLAAGVNVVPPGGTAYLSLDLQAGHYGYVSTEGDSPNDDYSHGLKGEFDVE